MPRQKVKKIRPLTNYDERFLSPHERAARVIVACRVAGVGSIYHLAKICNMNPSSLGRSIASKNVRLETMLRVAHALNCSLTYLTERNM